MLQDQVMVSERWDASGDAAWFRNLQQSRGGMVVDYDRQETVIENTKPPDVIQGRMPMHDDGSDDECPYLGGVSHRTTGGSAFAQLIASGEGLGGGVSGPAQRGFSVHRGDGRTFAHAGPSGPLFGMVSGDTRPSERRDVDEPLPAGGIPVHSVDRDTLLTMSSHDAKRALGKRFRRGRCDATGLTKVYYLHILNGLALKVNTKDKTASYRCCELDATSTRLGVMGQFSDGRLPTDFDTTSFDAMPNDASRVGDPHDIWFDAREAEMALKKGCDAGDAYEVAVLEARTTLSQRSVLLAYIQNSFLLSPVHIITVLILDDCGLMDTDANVLASLLRMKPSCDFAGYLAGEQLRKGAPDISGVELSEDKVEASGRGLVASPPLRLLSLRRNQLTDIGVMLLKKSVKYHPVIEEIRLEANNLIRTGEGLIIPQENLRTNPKFLIPFFDSDHCGGNEEIIVLRQRLDKNRRKNLQELQRPEKRSCFICF